MRSTQIQKQFKEVKKQIIRGSKINQKQLEEILLAPYQRNSLKEWEEFLLYLCSEVINLLSDEREEGFLKDYLYQVESSGECVVIGDIHGDIDSFWTVVKKENLLSDSTKTVIMMGDYIDRGPMQLSTLALALILKIVNRERMFLLRGNHEDWKKTEEGLSASVKGDEVYLFLPFWKKYLQAALFDEIYRLFEALPVLIELNGNIGLVHGGLPRPTNDMNEYDGVEGINSLNDPKKLYEMRWSRPENKEDVIITGSSDFSTARIHFQNFMNKLGWKILIRGHCPVTNGYEMLPVYKNRLITIHSTGCNPKTLDSVEPCSNTYYSYIDPVYIKIIDPFIEIWKIYKKKLVVRLEPKESIVEY